MIARGKDHGAGEIVMLIRLFRWARNNVERPGCMLTVPSDYAASRQLTLNV